MTNVIPTPSNYDEYVRQRNERTTKAMSLLDRIDGMYIRQNNLSVRMLFDNGYKLDSATDTMIRDSTNE